MQRKCCKRILIRVLKLLRNRIYSCIGGNFFAYSSCDSLTCPKINAPPSHIYVNPKVPYLSIFTLTVTISSLQPLQSLEHFADLLFLNRQCGNIRLGSYGTTGLLGLPRPSQMRILGVPGAQTMNCCKASLFSSGNGGHSPSIAFYPVFLIFSRNKHPETQTN